MVYSNIVPSPKELRLVCPQCKVTPICRSNTKGALPRCINCLKQNKHARLERQKVARKEGKRLSHWRKDGTRYGEKERLCFYCKTPFIPRAKNKNSPICESSDCKQQHKQELLRRKRDRLDTCVMNNPNLFKEIHLARTLKRFGLTIEWYRTISCCGICGTHKPGGKGRWHFDHDAACCSGCHKCFRGILCHNCNVGLGHFKDNPKFLMNAILWLHKSSSVGSQYPTMSHIFSRNS